MSDDLKTRLGYLADVVTPWGQHIALDARNRIEELEAKLDLSEGALDVASRSWGECQRMLEQTEAKLAKAVEIALEECPFAWGTGSYNDWWYDRRTTLAELKEEDRG